MGMRSSGAVEGRDDLLVDALCGFGITERGGHDLIDTCIDELADSIDDVVSRPCHRLADARGCRPTSPSVGAPRRVAFAPAVSAITMIP